MKTINTITALGALALANAQPALAQDMAAGEEPAVAIGADDPTEDGAAEDDMDALGMAILGAMIATMFEPEPLAPDAEARLPQAQAVAGSLVPDGVYGIMMTQLVESFTGPIFELAELGDSMGGAELAEYTGLSTDQTGDLSEEERNELTKMFDPVYGERASATIDMVSGMLNQVFVALEPGMREGLARAYAGRFTDSELAELQAFFATPTGAKYAAGSLPAYTDPQVISGLMQSFPALMEQLPTLIESLESVESDLPEPRRYDDLTPSEQRRASALLGVDQVTLRARMAEVDELEAMDDVERAVEAAAADTEANLDAMADDSWSEDDEAIPDVETDESPEAFEEAMEDVGT